MAIIESSIKIDAPSKTVWDLVSDLDAEPKYWKGTKSVISRKTTYRAMESIKITFTAGIQLG